MNINYTATVRNLVEFKKYINSPESDIDLNVFGEITKKDESVGDLFIYFLSLCLLYSFGSFISDLFFTKHQPHGHQPYPRSSNDF